MNKYTLNQKVRDGVIKVWGKYALFTRPEVKAEARSYPIMTPTAAVGILESIYWKPQFIYEIISITALNKIKYHTLKLNSVKDKISVANINKMLEEDSYYNATDTGGQGKDGNRTQINFTVLKDVAYTISYQIVPLDQDNYHSERQKHKAILNNRVSEGRCFQQPFLGIKEFIAYFDWATPQDEQSTFRLLANPKEIMLSKVHWQEDLVNDKDFNRKKLQNKLLWKQGDRYCVGSVVPEYREYEINQNTLIC